MSSGSSTGWSELCKYVEDISDFEAEEIITHLTRFGNVEELFYCWARLNYQNSVLLIDRYRKAGNRYTVLDLMTYLEPEDLMDREKMMNLILYTDDLNHDNLCDLTPILNEEELSWLSEVLYE